MSSDNEIYVVFNEDVAQAESDVAAAPRRRWPTQTLPLLRRAPMSRLRRSELGPARAERDLARAERQQARICARGSLGVLSKLGANESEAAASELRDRLKHVRRIRLRLELGRRTLIRARRTVSLAGVPMSLGGSAAVDERRSHAAPRAAAGWCRSSDGCRGTTAALLRGDVLAGIAVTAMIVPKDLGYAGIAGMPVQNGLYAAAAGALVYALFCTSRHISTGPSSSLAAVAGGAVLVTGVGGDDAAELVGGDHARHGRALPAAGAASPRLDRAVPLPGGRHRLPRGRRDRRRRSASCRS